MDTSEKYIKMCQKAEEIQAQANPKNGDFYFLKPEEQENIYVVANYETEAVVSYNNDHAFSQFDGGYEWEDRFVSFLKDATWLPRQDQLQEMLYEKEGPLTALAELEVWIHGENYDRGDWNSNIINRMVTLEQLWLSFVMKEKFNKTCNGEDWIKID